MLNRLARLLLALTSLAPIGVVYGSSLLPDHPGEAGYWFFGTVCMAVVAVGLLQAAARHGEQETLAIKEIKSVDKEVMVFLLTWALPLLVRGNEPINWPAFSAFLVLALIAVYQLNLMHVNPLLGVFRYHFYEVLTDSGSTFLLITRKNSPRSSTRIMAVRLSEDMWLDPK